jgi:hypothetical protein
MKKSKIIVLGCALIGMPLVHAMGNGGFQNHYAQGLRFQNGWPMQGDHYGQFNNLQDLTAYAMRDGAGRAISDTTRTTIGHGIAFIPSLIKNFGLMWGAFLYKLLYGSRGLSQASLKLISVEISRVVQPLTTKSYVSTDRVKRMNDIAQDMNNETQDENWERMKAKTIKVIDAAHSMLMTSLPCYDNKFIVSNGLSKLLARCAQTFSSLDTQQISRMITTTCNDLTTLKYYISQSKSLKDVELNTNHIKSWLALNLGNLEQLSALIEGETGMNLADRNYRNINNGGQMAMGQHQLSELLAAAAA